MASHRQTTSLNVQAHRTPSDPSGYPSTANEDAALLRESQQFRRDMEREAERWGDVLMESPSIDRRFLRRASLYLQPNLYDEVTHERHLAMTCSYPTCSNRPRRPFSDEQKWKITRSTTHNASIRGPNKRDIVEVAGNPEDGFCSPACAIRSRWYRSRLNVEPIWARPIVDAGDLEGFQMQLKAGRKVDSLPEEVDLLEDMEDKGEIAIENGQLHRIASADTPQRRPEEVRCGLSESPGSRTQPTHSRTTAPLPKTEIVAESREKPSSLMQRLEKTLSDLRIVEKSANTATNQASPTSKILSEPVQTQLHQASSVSVSASGLNQTSQSISQSSPTSHEKANISGVESVDTVQHTQRPTQANTRPTQAEMGGDDSADEESEDDETRMVFELALAAREELDAGTF